MDKIQVYLDNVFASLPKTIEVNEKQDQLYTKMINQYESYLNQGKSDAEAFGLVIQDFGSIEDIRYELNLVDHAYTEHFIPSSANPAILSIGVGLMIAGVMGGGFLYSLFLDDWICLLIFFVGVVSGTILLLWQSLKNTQQYGQDTLTMTVFGVALLATGIIGSGILNEMWVDFFVLLGFFLGYTGSGAILLIYLWINRVNKITTRKKPPKRIESIVYPVVTLVYLCIGFFFDGWHPWWLLYVAAAVFVQIYHQNH